MNPSPRSQKQNKTSVPKVIRLRDVTPRKFHRKIHSALDTLQALQKKGSAEIEPWKFAD